MFALLAACGRQPDSAAPASAPALTRGLGGEPETLDPRLAADNPSLELLTDLFEGLTTEAADGSIVPGCAESWAVSDDGLTWTFKLRPALRWSDGTPLDARAFARGIDEARTAVTQAPNAELLSAIRETYVQADGALVVKLSRPLPYLPTVLALPVAAPEPAAATDRSSAIVSNGPYRLLRRRPGQDIVLERNPHFHATKTVAIDRVRYLTTDSLDTELKLYRTGALDITSEVPNPSVGWIRTHLRGELHVAPYLSTYGYVVNGSRVPSRAAREALALAIDRNLLVQKITGAGEKAALGWVPPGLAGYESARFDWAADPTDARIARARAEWRDAMRDAAFGRKLRLCTDASANHHRTAIALASQWKVALGIDVEIVEMEWKAYLATRQRPGDCDLLRFGWSADFADPEAFLSVFESRHPQNVGGYSNPQYDDLMAKSRHASNATERAQLLRRAETVLLHDVPVIPLFHRVTKRLIKPSVVGAVPNPLGHLPSRYLALRP